MSVFKRTLNYFIVSSIVYRIPVAYFADLPRLVIVHKIVHARARHVARTDDEFQCRYESVSFAVALVSASPARSPLPHTSHVACRCTGRAVQKRINRSRCRLTPRSPRKWALLKGTCRPIGKYRDYAGLSSRLVCASDGGVRRPWFESHCRRLCLSRQPLRYTALGTGCAPLLQCLGRLSLPPPWDGKMSIILRAE